MPVALRLNFLLLAIVLSASQLAGRQSNKIASQEPTLDERDASEARLKDLGPQIPTYVDMPFEELLKRIPDLKEDRKSVV